MAANVPSKVQKKEEIRNLLLLYSDKEFSFIPVIKGTSVYVSTNLYETLKLFGSPEKGKKKLRQMRV